MQIEAEIAPDTLADAHLVLIDGSGFIFRAFHALPPMNRADGTPVNAVFGFTNMLARFLRDHVGSHLAVIFDAGRLTFRNELYGDYKAHRPEPPPELIPQFALVRDATAAFGIPAIELAGWEADDLIAAYAKAMVEAGGRCTIVSSDKDLMQLIRPGVDMLDPIKQKPIGEAEVRDRFGVGPDKVIEVQALMGDSVDNVPGVPGIGPKIASSWWPSSATSRPCWRRRRSMKPSKRRDMLIEHAEAARISRRLVILRDDAPLPLPIRELGFAQPDPPRSPPGWTAWASARAASASGWMAKQFPRHRRGHPPSRSPPARRACRSPATRPVTDLAVLQAWIAEAQAAGVCAIDTETDGLDPMRANLVGFSLASTPGRACYVPLLHDGDLENPVGAQIESRAAIEALAPLLTDPGTLKVFQNAKFDLLVLEHAARPAPSPIDDTMLISYAHGGRQPRARHGRAVRAASRPYSGHLRPGHRHRPQPHPICPRADLKRATDYAAEDADVTLRLWRTLRPLLRLRTDRSPSTSSSSGR